MYPVISGFAFYSVALLFQYMLEITLYYYYLTCLISIALVYFFGSYDQYSNFEPSGKYAVGCVEAQTKICQNRLLIYYPTDKRTKERYRDYKWAMDGEDMLKGLVKFAADIVPSNPFYFLLSLK